MQGFVLLLVAGLMLRTWYVEGLFVGLEVTGGSMAETLKGLHREVVCADCGRRFVCGTGQGRIRSRAICPNCGYAANDLASQGDVAGDRLLVHKSIFRIRPPRRWEVVAFRHPYDASEVCVKRVVGLPGETVQVRDGEVFVDGRIQRKTLAQQRALAVLVHDATRPPRLSPLLPPRWQNEPGSASWSRADGRFSHAPAPGSRSIDWLTYCHWYRVPGRDGEARRAAITNELGYNQTRHGRSESVHAVTDVLLSFRLVKVFGRGRLWVLATDGREEFRVRIDPGLRSWLAFRNGRPLGPAGRGVLPDRLDGLQVEVSLFDRQFLIALDGRTLVAQPYEPAPSPPEVTSRPLAVGSQGLGVQIEDLRVYRDVYYTHPVGPDGRWGLDKPVTLRGYIYFALGDNSEVSVDSRSWPRGPGVPAELVLGKPFFLHFPARRIDLGRWHFHVPDPGRIGYIR